MRLRRAFKQVPVIDVPVNVIMRSAYFERGFHEARRGEPFDWRVGDAEADSNNAWNYERGRCFAFIAPLNMPLRIKGKLNPKAIALCDAAFNRNLIV
jgi:hypothetical protein